MASSKTTKHGVPYTGPLGSFSVEIKDVDNHTFVNLSHDFYVRVPIYIYNIEAALKNIVLQYPGLGANGVVCTRDCYTNAIHIKVIFDHTNVYDKTQASLLAELFESLSFPLLAAVNGLRFQGGDVGSAIDRETKGVAALCAAASDLKRQIDHKNGLIVKLGGNALDVPEPPPSDEAHTLDVSPESLRKHLEDICKKSTPSREDPLKRLKELLEEVSKLPELKSLADALKFYIQNPQHTLHHRLETLLNQQSANPQYKVLIAELKKEIHDQHLPKPRKQTLNEMLEELRGHSDLKDIPFQVLLDEFVKLIIEKTSNRALASILKTERERFLDKCKTLSEKKDEHERMKAYNEALISLHEEAHTVLRETSKALKNRRVVVQEQPDDNVLHPSLFDWPSHGPFISFPFCLLFFELNIPWSVIKITTPR